MEVRILQPLRADMKNKKNVAFTLIELLTVIAVIAILAGLVLSSAGYFQRKAAISRAQTEIKGMEVACESYKADNGTYPIDSGTTITNSLHSGGSSPEYNPVNYQSACAVLYQAITGDGNDKLTSVNPTTSNGQFGRSGKCYFELKPNQTGSSGGTYYIVDPFGNCYGYSTAGQTAMQSGTNGNNSTYDIWSTAGTTSAVTSANGGKWVTNWGSQ